MCSFTHATPNADASNSLVPCPWYPFFERRFFFHFWRVFPSWFDVDFSAPRVAGHDTAAQAYLDPSQEAEDTSCSTGKPTRLSSLLNGSEFTSPVTRAAMPVAVRAILGVLLCLVCYCAAQTQVKIVANPMAIDGPANVTVTWSGVQDYKCELLPPLISCCAPPIHDRLPRERVNQPRY